jgi:hypothetical protein
MIEASLLAHYKAKLDKAIEHYLDMFHDKAVRLGADEETTARFMQGLYSTFEERRRRCLSEMAAIISGWDDEVERHWPLTSSESQ